MKLRINVPYILFIIYFYFFIFDPLLELWIPLAGYADELAAVAAIPIFAVNVIRERGIIRINGDKWWLFITLFLCIGFIGNVVYQYQPLLQIAIPDLFLGAKFWLAIYTGKNIFSRLNIPRFAEKIFFHIRLVTWLFAILIVLDQVFEIFETTVRYGIRSTTLFYGHPTIFAAKCVLLIGILLSIGPYLKRYSHYFIFILCLMCTTLRSKAFGAAFIFGFIHYNVLVRRKKINLKAFLFLIPIILLIAWDQIEYYFFGSMQSDSARYQLTIKAFSIAKDHFPLGSGFGTFASFFSSVQYSPLYYKYQLSFVNGLRKGAAYFVSDSFWPMILGQTGWFGLFFMASAMVCLFLCIQRTRKNYPAYNASCLCMFLYLLISSVAEAAFVHSIAIPLAIWLGALLQKSSKKKYDSKK